MTCHMPINMASLVVVFLLRLPIDVCLLLLCFYYCFIVFIWFCCDIVSLVVASLFVLLLFLMLFRGRRCLFYTVWGFVAVTNDNLQFVYIYIIFVVCHCFCQLLRAHTLNTPQQSRALAQTANQSVIHNRFDFHVSSPFFMTINFLWYKIIAIYYTTLYIVCMYVSVFIVRLAVLFRYVFSVFFCFCTLIAHCGWLLFSVLISCCFFFLFISFYFYYYLTTFINSARLVSPHITAAASGRPTYLILSLPTFIYSDDASFSDVPPSLRRLSSVTSATSIIIIDNHIITGELFCFLNFIFIIFEWASLRVRNKKSVGQDYLDE